MDIADHLEAYRKDPGPQTLQRLRCAILGSPGFDPRISISRMLHGIEGHDAVIAAIWERMPGLLLSPQAHRRLSLAYEATGRAAEASREDGLDRMSLDAIRAGSSGCQDDPFTVLRIEDEYDLLAATGHRSVRQEERATGGDVVDVHTLEDGRQWWFTLLWRSSSP